MRSEHRRLSGRTPRGDRRRGVALIVVILLLAALAAIGGPFLISAGLERRESRLFAARARARCAAEGAMARALWCLTRTDEHVERLGVYGAPFDTPEWDTLDELQVNFVFRPLPPPKGKKAPPWPKGLNSETFHSPRGEIWTALVEDEQGKINVNSAPPALLGSLIASAVLDQPLGRDDTSLFVTDTWSFPADGDERTIDGFVRVGREILTYTSKTDTSLDGLQREVFGTEWDKGSARAGALVYDARGWAVSAMRLGGGRRGGRPESFHSASAIRATSQFGVNFGGRAYRMGFSPAEYEYIERYLTAGSYRPKADGWVRHERIINNSWTADRTSFLLRDNSNYGPGTIVRFLDETGKVRGHGRVLRAKYKAMPDSKGGSVILEYGCGFEHTGGSEMYMEAELPHAINVNTAPIPVLAACMTGVGLAGRPAVTADEAMLVANRLAGYLIRNKDDLNRALEESLEAGELDNDLKRQAILENASVPGSTRLRLCTAPFCFRAHKRFTIEASAVVNSPSSGRPLAAHTVRQLVQMPTAAGSAFAVRSQKEWEHQMRAGFGRRVVTWPEPMVNKDAVPDERVDDGVGDVRLGTGQIGWKVLPKTRKVDNFNGLNPAGRLTPDGLSLRGGGVGYPARTCFQRSEGSVAPGSVELWVRPDSWAGRIFRARDKGAGNARNFIEVSYDSRAGELVMELADGTREGRTVVYRQPYNLDLHTWYHIKAIYKSTRLGGQAFVVDGTQVPPAGPARYDPMTTLVGDLDDTTPISEIDVEDTAGFPGKGAVVIDSEILEYDGKNPTQFLRARRAARYTQMHAHTGGAAVQIYGYAVKVNGSIPLVSGRVSGDMDANARCRIDMPPTGTPPTGGGLDDDDTEIKVDDTDGFQPSGYIWVGRECIYYDRKSATKFLDCERGVRGTDADDHADRSRISPASLRVSSLSGYPGSGYVQVDDAANSDRVEWLRYSRKITHKNRRYLAPAVLTDSKGNKYLESWRGRYGTGYRAHENGAKVIPVFRLRGPQCGNSSSPQYETVTVVDDSGSSEQHRLKHVYEATWPNYTNTIPRQFTGWGHEWRAAFDDYTGRTYSGSQCRLLRFPSGELPLHVDDFQVAPGMEAVLDEVRVTSGHSAAGFLPLDLTLAPADTAVVVQMPSDAQARAVPNAGVLAMGDEIIYYSAAGASRRRLPFTPRLPFQKKKPDPEDYHRKDFPVVVLNGVRRAVLGSNSRTHAPWSPAIFLEAQPVTELSGPTAGAIDTVSLRSAGGFEDEGYALVGSEIIGYARKRGRTLEGAHFRGAFGTTSQAHAGGTLALPLPFRYWDRYLAESDRSELAFYQGSFSAKGTRFYTLSLNVAGTTWTRIRTQVRFDGAPGWDSVPGNREGELYEFEGPGPHQLRTAGGRPVRADQIEYRILFEYLTGAAAGDGWKQTPRIDSLFIEYGNPLVVLRREVGVR